MNYQDRLELVTRQVVYILDSQGYIIKWRQRATVRGEIQRLLDSTEINGDYVTSSKEVLRKRGLLYRV